MPTRVTPHLSPAAAAAAHYLGPAWAQLPGFLLLFGAVFVGAQLLLTRAARQPLKRAALLSSCAISTLHGLTACVAGYLVLRRWWPGHDVNAPNTPAEVRLPRGRHQGAEVSEAGPWLNELYTFFLAPLPPPAWLQEQLVQLSTAYMLVDLSFFCLPFTPGDAMIVGHHLVTTFVMAG